MGEGAVACGSIFFPQPLGIASESCNVVQPAIVGLVGLQGPGKEARTCVAGICFHG